MGFGFCLYAAAAILVLPLDWLIAFLLAAAWHELCHIAAIYFCTGCLCGVRADFGGARIRIPNMSAGRECLCALAGPLGGAVLILFYPLYPKLAVCALVQSAYNLLPVYPLDGGRALRCLLDKLLPQTYADYISQFTASLCIGILLALGVFAWRYLHLGPVLLIFGLVILVRSRKFPCKERPLAVQ